jgi:hypothetical protein
MLSRVDMGRAIAWGVLVVAACGAPSRAPLQPAAPPAAPPAPSASPEVETDAQREAKGRADAAVDRLAAELAELDTACRDLGKKSEATCDRRTFDALAVDYQAYYAAHDDARAHEGRIDALPRLGGRGLPADDVASRIRTACVERCDLARRAARGDARDEERERARREYDRAAERMRRAPLAERRACFRTCVSRCTGGRVLPGLDGVYPRSDDDWCGTCEMDCRARCSP